MKVSLKRQEIIPKLIALTFATIIITSSATAINVMVRSFDKSSEENHFSIPSYNNHTFQARSILTSEGFWESFDSKDPGTPAEAHVVVSDTSGLIIVVDFHGFWRENATVDGAEFDQIEMPGASSILIPGQPMLPRLSEFVEIPQNVMISCDVLAASSGKLFDYNVTPAPRLQTPVGIGVNRNLTSTTNTQSTYFDAVYENTAFFPAELLTMEGGSNLTPQVIRGHRIASLSIYPVRFNPDNGTCIIYSQLVIKLRYETQAQINPINNSLWSESYELILRQSLLYYDSCHLAYRQHPGIPTVYVPKISGVGRRAEYLIITTDEFYDQAHRLAEWKQQKGIPSAIEIVPEYSDQSYIKTVIENIYNRWSLVPTFVVILGDVQIIPTNYDMIHEASYGTIYNEVTDEWEKLYYFDQEHGYIASDLGYFSIDGHDYFPDMINSRISVNTTEQARVIVDKILQYEQAPPEEPIFYNSILSLAFFEDRGSGVTLDGKEQEEYPLCYTAERIRFYLENDFGYDVHYNYSAYYDPGYVDPNPDFPNQQPFYFFYELDGSKYVYNEIPWGYDWFPAYEDGGSFASDFDDPKNAIIANLQEGRFLVYYSGHGDSKNMVYTTDINDDDNIDRNDRGLREGWMHPFFNITNIPELQNGNMTPLILSMACNTGWFDGETDQYFMDQPEYYPNPYSDYDNSCFAENMTRQEGGGAIAVIAPSRLSYSRIQGDLLDGIIQAFLPEYLAGQTHPIYEMGAALLYGKLYAAKLWEDHNRDEDVIRTTFEEYHLFGDAETQLWTGMPSRFDVSYPVSVGTGVQQRFVVSVRNETSLEPVNFAKVCIQQEPGIYQVGYTNARGQVIFNITPTATISHVNVTVTKHNFKPHIGWMAVHESSSKILLSKYYGVEGETITFYRNHFAEDFIVWIYMDNTRVAELNTYDNSAIGRVPPGSTGYLNVWAVVPNCMVPARMWTPVSVDRFARISEDEGPDVYLYSQDDSETWTVTGGVRVWDNPDIIIKRNGVVVTSTIQHVAHEVIVTVHNKGSEVADHTFVTLSYARIGGGMSYTPIETKEDIVVHPFIPTEVSFTFTPELPGQACLMVRVDENDEWVLNEKNNEGMENVGVVEMQSPGTESFQVANPESTEYILIKVKQLSNIDDIWNVTVAGHATQAMITNLTELVALHINPIHEIEEGDSQTYEILIIGNCRVIGGMIFNASILPPRSMICIFGICLDTGVVAVIGGAIVLFIIGVIYYRKK